MFFYFKKSIKNCSAIIGTKDPAAQNELNEFCVKEFWVDKTKDWVKAELTGFTMFNCMHLKAANSQSHKTRDLIHFSRDRHSLLC